MKKFVCTVHAETRLPPAQPTRATSIWKSALTATHSLLASRSWWIPPDAWSASAGSTRKPQTPRSNNGAGFETGLRHGGGFVLSSWQIAISQTENAEAFIRSLERSEVPIGLIAPKVHRRKFFECLLDLRQHRAGRAPSPAKERGFGI